MFKCQKCGATFDCPEEAVDSVEEYFGRKVNMMISVCPECGSEEIDRMHRCWLCNEWHDGEGDYCKDCEEILTSHIDRVLDDLCEWYKFDRQSVVDAMKEVY